MKIYTNTFDLARISPHRFWVAPYSDFKFGVKIVKNGEAVANTFTVKAGATTLTPDETTVDGFKTYTVKSDDTGFVEYTIEVANIAEKLKLLQIVTDSTVFEVGGGGGDVPADVATQSWVNSQISDFITEDALNGYATEDYVASQISDFVTDDELTAYATKAELTAYAETADLTAYATKDELTGYVQNGDLTAYATVDSLSDYAEASALTAYAQKTDIKDSTITITQGGVTKGSFTLNQATGETIEIDAGGGSSAISAFDLSESPVWSKTQVEEALHNNICLPQTIFQFADNTLSVLDAEGELNVTNAPNVIKKLLIGTKCTAFKSASIYQYGPGTTIIPDSVSAITGMPWLNSHSGAINTPIVIPDTIVRMQSLQYNSDHQYIDFGNTRTSMPTITTQYGYAAGTYYVPDAIYESVRTTAPWNVISASIHPHSELEAPYATSTAVSALTAANSKVTGGAETGTTGTPAAVNTVKSVYETDWTTLSASADANTFYVVLPDPA